jgi:hypothetical protein
VPAQHPLDGDTAALWRFDHGPREGWRRYVRDLGPNGFHALASSFTLSGLQRPIGPNKAIVRSTLDAGQANPPATDHRFTIDATTVAALKTSYTIEAFVYLSQTSTTRSILSIGAAANSMLINFEISTGGRLRLAWFNAGVVRDHIQSAVSPMTTGTWYHVAIVKDTPGAFIYMYINGALVDTIAKQIEPNGSGTAGYLFSQLGASLGFVGGVRDVTIIPGVKSGAAIAARAALLSTTFELPVDSSALLHFRADESSDVMIDEVGRSSSNLVGNIPLIMDRLLPEHRYAPDLIADDGYSLQLWDGNYANSYLQGDATFGAAVVALRGVLQSSVGFTFECWLNLGELTPPGQVLRGVFRFGSKLGDAGQANADMNFLMVSINSDGSITYWSEYGTDADSIHTTATAIVPIGDTFHLAIRRNATDGGTGLHTVDVFINGSLVETLSGVEPFTGGGNTTFPQFRIGYGTSPSAEHTMYGYVDDVRISSRPRTDEEILESFELGMPPVPGPLTISDIEPIDGEITPGEPGAFSATFKTARLTPITFHLSNIGARAIAIAVKFEHYNETFVCRDAEGTFVWPFDVQSQNTFVYTDPDEEEEADVSILPRGGWPRGRVEFKVAAAIMAEEA